MFPERKNATYVFFQTQDKGRAFPFVPKKSGDSLADARETFSGDGSDISGSQSLLIFIVGWTNFRNRFPCQETASCRMLRTLPDGSNGEFKRL